MAANALQATGIMISHFPMRGLIAFVMALIFGAAQCLAAPMAACQHADAAAHDAAREGGDAAAAAVAHHEDSAAAAAEKHGSLADQGANGLANAVMPGRPAFAMRLAEAGLSWRSQRAALSIGRTLEPLLKPPLA